MWSFDNLDRDWLIRFLEHRIGDRRIIRLITKWLNAGVMDGGEWKDDLRGTPQGAVVSPILANIYLHYVLDLWFDRKWRPQEANGDAVIVRYADDFVVGFQHRQDAEQFLDDLERRLSKGCNFRRAYWESCVSKELASVICFATTGFVSRFRPCVRNRWVFRLGGMLGRECSTQHVVYG